MTLIRNSDFVYMLRRLVKVSAFSFTCVLAGCATVRPVPVTLPLPVRPVLTPIQGNALQCLAPATYTTIVDRERALRTWGLSLEAIIGANNAKAKP